MILALRDRVDDLFLFSFIVRNNRISHRVVIQPFQPSLPAVYSSWVRRWPRIPKGYFYAFRVLMRHRIAPPAYSLRRHGSCDWNVKTVCRDFHWVNNIVQSTRRSRRHSRKKQSFTCFRSHTVGASWGGCSRRENPLQSRWGTREED